MYVHWNSDIHMFGGCTGCSCCIQSTECSRLQFAYVYPTYVVLCPPNWRFTGHAGSTHTHTPSTNIGTTNQSTPLPRHLRLYGVGARRHLRWWLHDWLARQTLDLAEPCRLAIVTVGRGPKKHKAHWKSFKLHWHLWICAALAYVFADV